MPRLNVARASQPAKGADLFAQYVGQRITKSPVAAGRPQVNFGLLFLRGQPEQPPTSTIFQQPD